MKVSFLIDGFNLYHSIEDLEKNNGIKAKWLDIKTLLHSYMGAIGGTAKFEKIFYFTALRLHVQKEKPNSIERHKRYIAALETKGIEAIYGGFKPKEVFCKKCNETFETFEEKKTDVAIASKIIELAAKAMCDVIAIVSGDTDLIPAIELAKQINPKIKIIVFFPYKRTNDELKIYTDQTYSIKPQKYQNSQFKGLVQTALGDFAKPSHW
ncbi:NYN domain-containing protein [Fluviicola taffensis]|uniref:NYN domain-containing protein n=1 Tax=Fluviicola taffensis (strain DSM 16823 / NCIMB 13979 / RW262) TaxID=755732 RepID=F2II65_FLUTR|nr:NYN domain-containing protein [Fluviicola taffensis]AEA43774.1 hypothetical protein Fluta_1784 [Fluviicola taffensis DSM 16823]